MVKELYVQDNRPTRTTAQEDQLLYEFVVEGVPLPDEFAEDLRARSGLEWMYRDAELRSPSAKRAAMEWDAFHLKEETK